MERGHVSLVGAGPGDPDLLTVGGRRRLEEADVVVYDRLVHPEILALARPEAERIFIGKAYGRHVLDQEELSNLLVFLAASGKRVVRLKGGDPFTFGRGGEEAEALVARGIPFDVVPGISAGAAAPAYAGIPVTDRRYTSSVTYVTGHKDPADPSGDVDWAALARAGGTIVVFMGLRHISAIAAALVAAGRPSSTPVAVIEQGTLEVQREVVSTLGSLAADMAEAQIVSPAVIVIGEVVRLRERLAWFGRTPVAAEARDEAGGLRPPSI